MREGAGQADNETLRLEAFSDGVFAIAVTLLVLEIKIPHELRERPLADALWRLWPSYVAYVISFLTILIMWINHHRLFKLVRRCDNGLLIFNGLLLLLITFIPFPTAILSEYLESDNGRAAAIFFSGTYVVLAAAFNLLWWWIKAGRLVDAALDKHRIDAITKQYRVGPVMYTLVLVLAFVNVYASVAANMMLAAYYAIPKRAKELS